MAEGILNPIEQLEADLDFNVYTKPEVDALLDQKADKADTYTKTETDDLLSAKADADSVYTKTETDSLLSAKADVSSVYTKTETDNLLNGKADVGDVYTKTETDNLLNDKADKSTTYTKTETDNLLSAKADSSSVYTKTEIDNKIPSSVGSATKPVYVNGGVVSACTYSLNKDVPSNAVFTDTTYSAGNGLTLAGTTFSAKAGNNVSVDASGINADGNGSVASADSGLISGNTAYNELRPTKDGSWIKTAQNTATNLEKLESGLEYAYEILSKKYDALKKYVNGNFYDFDTDSDSKYVKTIPSSVMPYASINSIGGKTVVWNQLLNNTGTINIATTDTAQQGIGNFSGINSHKYLLTCTQDTTLTSNTRNTLVIKDSASTRIYENGNANANLSAGQRGWLVSPTTLVSGTWDVLYWGNSPNANYSVTNFMVIDLTLLYGSGNEPTTVAEFESMFPAQYYAYDSGTLLSADVQEVKSVGKNLCDAQTIFAGESSANIVISGDEWDVIKPSAVYTKHFWDNTIGYAGQMTISYYKKDTGSTGSGYKLAFVYTDGTIDAIVSSHEDNYAYKTLTSNANKKIQYVGASYNQNQETFLKDVQIEFGTTATTYAPYRGTIQSYSIPASIQSLTGYGWSAGQVYNEVDLENKKYIQRVGSRSYTAGDESDNTVITDGTTTYYPLNPAVETDISQYLDDNTIEVEAGGTLTFENSHGDDYRIPVPSEEEYMIDLSV